MISEYFYYVDRKRRKEQNSIVSPAIKTRLHARICMSEWLVHFINNFDAYVIQQDLRNSRLRTRTVSTVLFMKIIYSNYLWIMHPHPLPYA